MSEGLKLMKAEDVYNIVYQNTNEIGFVDIGGIECDIKRWDSGFRYYGGEVVSVKTYNAKTNLKKRLDLMRDSMFDSTKKYYNLRNAIDNLFYQWFIWKYERIYFTVSKKWVANILNVSRPTLDEMISEMIKYGHKPYSERGSYHSKAPKKIDLTAFIAFLIKKCELQNGEDSVSDIYRRIGDIQSKW